ncbi:TetR family transcriptional regulator [Tsukamurella asaccharolytica]|uniref:TetR family transcriptional regulator n=1 Tax=Tsukamurella asaccharolytica TaxID=2592067 RepID=A0A5C5R7F3_9ACTN|nr:TetR/AcrR family transcriptional regulator [Tsukamurella asaccharolytica]TWS18552.1 TetR family transcriptional regulator [Tsukamurella asaccharolytica]
MPRQVDHEERRAEIDRAVWAIIADEGVAAVTLRAIAARARISMGRVQHYFPTRDAIVEHALTSYLALAERAHPVPEDRHEALVMLLTHAIPRDGARRLGAKVWYAYLAEAVTDPGIRAIVGEALRGSEDLATELLDGDRPRARTLLAAADALAYRALIGVISADEAEAAVRALAGVSPGPG